MGGAFTQGLVVLGILQFMVWVEDQTVKVTEELLRQHEEQRSQEMAWLLEMEHRSQESPGGACCSWPASSDGSGPLWRCSSCFGFYWLPRQGSSGYNSSACGEAPAVPRRNRRSRKRMRGIADYGDKLDPIWSPDMCLEWKDMQNSEDRMESMINASAKPFLQETFGQSCIQGIH